MLLPSPASSTISGISSVSASEIDEFVKQSKTDFIEGKSLAGSSTVSLTLETTIGLKPEAYNLEI